MATLRKERHVGLLNNLYEKHKGKIAVQAREQLEPGESVERLVLARTEKGGTRQVAAFATEENVYAADVGLLKSRTLKEAKVKFPIAKTRAMLDKGKLHLAYNRGLLCRPCRCSVRLEVRGSSS